MRFSLATLMLLTIFIALLLTVWALREPWVAHTPALTFDELSAQYPLKLTSRRSPDGTRAIGFISHFRGEPKGYFILVFDSRHIDEGVELAKIENDGLVHTAFPTNPKTDEGFMDDDTMLVNVQVNDTKPVENIRFAIFKRRFPEWWWGHFYRPEVWLSIVLGIVLIVRSAKAWRTQKSMQQSTLDPVH